MWITIIKYFDFGHVSIQFPCIHIYISLLSLFVSNATYVIKTMDTWKDTVTWVQIQMGNDSDDYYMDPHAKRVQFYVILCGWTIIFVMM